MRESDRRQTYDELLGIIRGVRRRWRTRMLLRGLAAAGGVTLVALLVAGALLGALDQGPDVVLGIRIGVAVVVAAAAVLLVVRPLLRRVSDEAVALYLEEHEPSLEAAVLSALEARGDEGARRLIASDALMRRTLENAIGRCHAIDDGRWIEQKPLIRVTAALAGVVMLGALVGLLGPDSARRGASLLFSTPRPAEAAGPVGIHVLPGDATISRGADVSVSAGLRGVEGGLVELAVRAAGDTAFDRLPMARGPDGRFGYLLFDLDRETEYYVEADGVRSPAFRLTVAELPYVDRLGLELVFPPYTGLPPEVVEDGGDVTALRGTTVRVRVTSTVPVTGGGIVVDGADPIPLVPEEATPGDDAPTGDTAAAAAPAATALVGEFRVRADGFYHIVLAGPDGAPVEASPRYVIDALSDGEPIVAFEEPGRDERATAIDELFVEARAEDDYGVAGLTLHYAVNGGPERTVELYGGSGGLREVTAGHTFYLEEFSLEPGDLVSYWATAADNDAVAGGKPATSDIYFVQIQPFSREFRAADQRQPPPGGQGQQEGGGDLSERQRQIVAATFNLVRDSATLSPTDRRENLNTLALAQERLRDDARALAGRMVARQVTQDTAFQQIARLLPAAAEEMDRALARLRASEPSGALPPEQRSLRLLQRAEAVFREVQVTLGQNQGGGGQPGGAPNAEDLADLFELEMDKLQDQYETVNRSGPGGDSAQAEVDETRERLEELARRQQREAERRRREALRGQGTAGGAAQRELAEQVEEEARRLERLSRDQRRPELEEAARRLRQAAESMRRSAAGQEDGDRAAEGLRDARRLLERSDTEQLRRRAGEAAERADELAREQERVRRESERLRGMQPGAARDERARELEDRKERQQEDVASLERDLRRLAAEAGAEQPETARRLRDGASAISESQLEEKLDFSRQLTRGGAPDEYADRLERQIQEDLDEVRDRLDGVEETVADRESGEEAERALEQARSLARGLESMRERTEEMRESASGNPRGDRGFDPDAVRQFRGEADRRLQDARALGQQLRREASNAAEADREALERVIDGIEELTDAGSYDDPEELARLQTALADQAKRLELLLRVRLAGEEGLRLFQSGDAVVPAEYRELVDAYYRSLSRENEPR